MKKYSPIIAATFIAAALIALIITSCSYNDDQYGVFLSYEDDLERLAAYDTVVIDAQYYEKESIESFKQQGHKVYSYINIGSLETFRAYYDQYQDLTLGDYEHWDEERWIDVSSPIWQDFVLETLAPELLEKGIDGYFVDNCDVYYQYPEAEILEGLSVIMEGLKSTGADIIVNGGDAFVEAYTASGGRADDIITGINQESVFTRIDWNTGNLYGSTKDDMEYFTNYIEKYSSQGIDIYLLEYTKKPLIVAKIKSYCHDHNFKYYVSPSIELNYYN